MKITIVGGGNIGTQFAVHCAEKGNRVTVYTSEPDLFNGEINIIDENGIIIHKGNIYLATNDPKAAFSNTDLIIVTYPAMLMDNIANIIEKYIDRKTLIGVVPGNGGSECAFKKSIERGNVFFGIERVPAVARLVNKGKTVKSTGYRNELHIASIPNSEARKCCDIMQNLFDIPCVPIPNYLNLTLTPSNPILHTTRLYTIFEGYHEGVKYSSLPLFYEEWNDKSSEILLKCDDEVQSICKMLPEFELNYVKSLREHYESYDVKALTRKISSITAFKGLKTPFIEVDGGFIPDLQSRYFVADFSYGLAIINQIANMAEVNVPTIQSVLEWYNGIAISNDEFSFEHYGINGLTELKKMYCQ